MSKPYCVMVLEMHLHNQRLIDLAVKHGWFK